MSEEARWPPAHVPDGIEEVHAAPRGGLTRHASPLSLAVLGFVVALGMLGVLGHERDWAADANGASLSVHSPETIRNGEFFETRVTVEVTEPIGELVIGVDAALWEDMTVNTMIPAASEETSQDGEYRFTFATLEPGTTFLFKVDLQVNPDILGGNQGAITVYDGSRELVGVDLGVTVLP